MKGWKIKLNVLESILSESTYSGFRLRIKKALLEDFHILGRQNRERGFSNVQGEDNVLVLKTEDIVRLVLKIHENDIIII